LIYRLFVNHHLRSAQIWHVFSRDLTVLLAHSHIQSAIGISHTCLCLPSYSWFSCKAAETKVSVPRRYYQLIFHENKFSTTQYSKLQQLPLTANVDIHCHVILRKPKEASFHAKEEDKLLHPCNISKSGHISTCKHYTLFLVSLILSIINHSVQARSKNIS